MTAEDAQKFGIVDKVLTDRAALEVSEGTGPRG